MTAPSNNLTLSLHQVEETAKNLLLAMGYSGSVSDVMAKVIRHAERGGPASHGLAMLSYYKTVAMAGKINLDPHPSFEAKKPGLMIVDCDNGFTQLGLELARRDFVQMTKNQGCAAMVTQNAHHIAALRHDILPLAEAGLIAIMMSGSRPWVVPQGGETAIFGTNPMAFACPRPDAPPIVWDQAVSLSAISDVRLAAEEGTTFVSPVGLDNEGEPSCDPVEIIAAQRMFTYGQHKGTSIALMIEILAAGLTGGRFAAQHSAEVDGPTNPTGQTILAIDPDTVQAGFVDRLSVLLEAFEGNGTARIPGDGRLKRTRRTEADGVAVPAWLQTRLTELGWDESAAAQT